MKIKSKLYEKNKLNFIFLTIFSLLETASTIIVSIMLEKLISIAYAKDMQEFKIQGIIFLILLLGMVFFFVIAVYVKPKYKKKALSQYKQNIYSLIIDKNISSFNEYETSNYISALTNDVNYIEGNYIFSVFDLIKNITVFIASLVVMILYSPLLTIIAIVLSLLPALCSLAVGDKLTVCEKNISDNNASFMHYIKDNLIGFSTIKVFKAEKKMVSLFNKSNDKLDSSKARKTKVIVTMELIQSVTYLISQFGVFFVGAYLCITTDEIEPATIILFVQLMNFILGPLLEIPGIVSKRKACKPLFEKIEKLVNSKKDELENVSFEKNIIISDLNYGIDEKNILNGVDLKIEKNKSYAIVGPSGSGKTTLLNLIIGRTDNYQGCIMYDEKDLKKVSSDSLYEIVTFIEQNVFVFDDSIENNITMFSDVDKKLLDEVIEKSGLKNLVVEKGLNYKCGENGCNLSGGEKQRIAIARGLLKNSKIMLLDEVTSALDNEVSNTITNNLLDLHDLTKIMITHKLEENILKRFDSIIIMKDGRIHDQGDYDTLINNCNLFKTLVELN